MIIEGNDPFTQPSFTLRNRIGRALWGAVWLLLFRPSPRPVHCWRRLLLRTFGARIGSDVNVHADVRIWAPWQLRIGNRVGIGSGAVLYNMAALEIGNDCVVSQRAHLCGGSHDIDAANFQLVARPIVIADKVWICSEAFVGLGVTIAEGCVIGARAVVTRSITEPWTVWAGNPAQQKRRRRQPNATGTWQAESSRP